MGEGGGYGGELGGGHVRGAGGVCGSGGVVEECVGDGRRERRGGECRG